MADSSGSGATGASPHTPTALLYEWLEQSSAQSESLRLEIKAAGGLPERYPQEPLPECLLKILSEGYRRAVATDKAAGLEGAGYGLEEWIVLVKNWISNDLSQSPSAAPGVQASPGPALATLPGNPPARAPLQISASTPGAYQRRRQQERQSQLGPVRSSYMLAKAWSTVLHTRVDGLNPESVNTVDHAFASI